MSTSIMSPLDLQKQNACPSHLAAHLIVSIHQDTSLHTERYESEGVDIFIKMRKKLTSKDTFTFFFLSISLLNSFYQWFI